MRCGVLTAASATSCSPEIFREAPQNSLRHPPKHFRKYGHVIPLPQSPRGVMGMVWWVNDGYALYGQAPAQCNPHVTLMCPPYHKARSR